MTGASGAAAVGVAREQPDPDELLRRARERQEIVRNLQLALRHEPVAMVFQPVVELASGRIVAAEALLQSQRAYGLSVSPDRFDPVTEAEGDRTEAVGRWVLTTACSEMASITRRLRRSRGLGVALNLSARQLAGPGLVDDVATALRLSGLRGGDLCVEFTQSSLERNLSRALLNLEALRAMGVRNALDDCREGYAPLLYVQHLRLDHVKIEAGFIGDVSRAGAHREVVRSVIAQAHGLGARVVATDIEGPEQVSALAELGCDLLQGPYFAPPLPAADLLLLCQREQSLWDQVGGGH